MMRRTLQHLLCIAMLVTGSLSLLAGTTGKIAGTVVEDGTNTPLAGANVIIDGSSLGAAADINGNFTILHIPPGLYDVTVTVIGYTPVTVQQVRVRIDQTARVDISLKMEALEGETVTVVADRNQLKEDVATSVVAVSDREVQELPMTDVEGVVALQAGIRNDFEIRGGEANTALFMLDGVTMRDPRNNEPVGTVALSSVQEISVERGGFSAEYGNVQSGLINVVTKEGGKRSYSGSITTKYSPPMKKYSGISIHDPNSFWMRPYLDDDVCWTGTNNGAWDRYTKDQYREFSGWNAVSENLFSDDDPTNDLTPLAAQRAFLYETRKGEQNKEPDYDIDAGFGGPVPFIGEKLGDLRFFTSYRKHREMLIFPLTRPDYSEYDWNLHLTSDISPSMKLKISGVKGKRYTMEANWVYGLYLDTPESVAWRVSNEERWERLFSTGHFSLADIGHTSIAAKLTHTLNPNTFYEVTLEHFQRDYNTRPGRDRDLETMYEIVPGYSLNEFPYGYDPDGQGGMALNAAQHASKARDNTVARSTTLKANLTSQVNFNNLVKTGFEFVYNNIDLDYGSIASLTQGSQYAWRLQLNARPIRFAYYLQDKLETKGFTLNAGLRLDYSNSREDWWNTDPYDATFYTAKYNEENEYDMVASKGQWQLSPRLGISHPITENSKLFFNYGHFKQMPKYEELFRVARSSSNDLNSIGDPNMTLAKTVSYELGYDHIILRDYLIQTAAFYNDISNQQDSTVYQGSSGNVNYYRTTSNSYADTRGFELTLRKTHGRWLSGFANYTYQVTSSGHFGRQQMYNDPLKQRNYDENTSSLYQEKPLPAPFARVNLSIYTPDAYGPSILGHHILGGLLMNALMDWEAGDYFTYNPKILSNVRYNIQGVDYMDFTLRFTKTFTLQKMKLQFLVDVENALNAKRMTLNNFANVNDQNAYMASLHLPESDDYENVPGDDKYGDFRDPDVDFQPIEYRGVLQTDSDTGNEGVIYYDGSSGRYMEYVQDGDAYVWQDVEKKRLNKILDDKAYIDMPNNVSFNFLNPRQIFFGVRLSFDLN